MEWFKELLFFYGKKKFNFFCFSLIETQNPPDLQDKKTPLQNWSIPPQIRQKLKTHQKYFLPARQLSNLPELSKSGGENCHLATLI
jgi:hypothetical protein